MSNRHLVILWFGIYLIALGFGFTPWGDFSGDAYIRGASLGIITGILTWRKKRTNREEND
ncbi:hypothetical protein LCGC14_1969480 [marine sediment metagenome]|uniref:Uncharacterized protein n=1 Tax=marine sediment metagenome TaxID=412755 RepID=A0A0F9FCL5_9ZZZZ